MKLHAKNMAVSAGAVGEEVGLLAARLQAHEGHRTQSLVETWLAEMANPEFTLLPEREVRIEPYLLRPILLEEFPCCLRVHPEGHWIEPVL